MRTALGRAASASIRTAFGQILIAAAGWARCALPISARRLALDAVGRDAYLSRAALDLAGDAGMAPGQWLVGFRGHPLGIALRHRSGLLEGLFPSRWSGCTGGAEAAATGADD